MFEVHFIWVTRTSNDSEIQLMMDMDLVRGGAPGAWAPGVF